MQASLRNVAGFAWCCNCKSKIVKTTVSPFNCASAKTKISYKYAPSSKWNNLETHGFDLFNFLTDYLPRKASLAVLDAPANVCGARRPFWL